jgi:predicted TIM-barrel fold metal-dependent hydrolase
MGIATGRFVIDTHVHAQRHAAKFKARGVKPDFSRLGEEMMRSKDMVVYDNSPRLLYDMDRYGVDMCVLVPAFSMTDEINLEIVKNNPDRFIAQAGATDYLIRSRRGEIKWTIEGLCDEFDRLLATGMFPGGIGEGFPLNPDPPGPYVWEERFEEICQMMDVVQKHGVPATYHTGMPTGYAGARQVMGVLGRAATDWGNPLLCHDVAAAYPDVPIILQHGGMQGGWSEMYMEPSFEVAASHDNVYLECGMYWADLYEKALIDPNIGAEKLIWGTDWGASIPIQYRPGLHPQTYFDQNRKQGLPIHQIDYFGWSLRQLDKLDIPQDDMNLILGGNAVRLFKIEDRMPHTRMFKEYAT